MCGILGIVSGASVAQRLLQGLKRLEYRGYDSAGIATLHENSFQRHRVCENLEQLDSLLEKKPLLGNIGIGHTRWATHGAATEQNAHPHMTGKVAVVHNGIVENYAELKKTLSAKKYVFESTTDTEVLAHLMTHFLEEGDSLHQAVKKLLAQIEGSFALAFLFVDYPDQIVVLRRGSPLVIGYGEGEMFIGSDALSLSSRTRQICYLEEGDYAFVSMTGAQIFDEKHSEVQRPISESTLVDCEMSKGDYRHFMLKEIFEQPNTVEQTIDYFVDHSSPKALRPVLTSLDFSSWKRIRLIACGSSYYASAIAQYWFEKLADIPVTLEISSEYRYRGGPVVEDELAIFVSQSGETIDTLASLSLCKSRGQSTLAIVNTPESSMARLADQTLYTMAGTEIGVASTKTFTAQLTLFLGLALSFAQARNTLSAEEISDCLEDLCILPRQISDLLKQDTVVAEKAKILAEASDVLYIGRGTSYPMALEGALKLKEIAYIHAEGLAAGELKHGSIALVDETVPLVVLLPSDRWFKKTASNLQEVLARKGKVICLTDKEGREKIEADSDAKDIAFITLSFAKSRSSISTLLLTPILHSIPIQLLAYYTALIRGTNVDKPRNLAKSVTVE